VDRESGPAAVRGIADLALPSIADSATGELRGLRGEGTSAVGHGNEHPFALNYDWE